MICRRQLHQTMRFWVQDSVRGLRTVLNATGLNVWIGDKVRYTCVSMAFFFFFLGWTYEYDHRN